MSVREQAIEAAARAVVVQGNAEKDTLRVGENRAAAALDAAVPVLLNDLADRIELQRPHIPPSTDPNRMKAIVARSSFNRAARVVRAAAEGWTE